MWRVCGESFTSPSVQDFPDMSVPKYGFTAMQIIEQGRTSEENIRQMQNWLAATKLPKLSDEQVVLYLLSCCNDQEAAKATIQAYYTLTANNPDVANDRRLCRQDLQKQLRTIDYCVIPERTDEGSTVAFFRLKDSYYASFSMAQAMTLFFMTVDAAIHDEPPNGLVVVVDMTGIGVMHLTRATIRLTQTSADYLQEALQIKLQAFHIINTVPIVDKILFLLKPFLNESFYNKLHLHSKRITMDKFYEKWVPKRCMPQDYGGYGPSVEVLHNRLVDKLVQLEPFFDAEELQRTPENNR